MSDLFRQRTAGLQQRLQDENLDLALLAHPDSVYYLTAYWGDLGVEFGRPTVAAVTRDGGVTIITAEMETEMARALTRVDGEAVRMRDAAREERERRIADKSVQDAIRLRGGHITWRKRIQKKTARFTDTFYMLIHTCASVAWTVYP